MARRWLLLLGSTLADDARVRAALVALGELGAVRLLAPIRHGPGSRDPRRSYFNALAELECALGRDPLIAALKAIEHTLGRRRGQAEVAIDIDLLACGQAGRWHADAHALDKGEFAQPHTLALLQAAGIAPEGLARD